MPILVPDNLTIPQSTRYVRLAQFRPDAMDSLVCDCNALELSQCFSFYRAVETSGLPPELRLRLIRGNLHDNAESPK